MLYHASSNKKYSESETMIEIPKIEVSYSPFASLKAEPILMLFIPQFTRTNTTQRNVFSSMEILGYYPDTLDHESSYL